MIIARSELDSGTELLVLGLSRENIARILDGNPVVIRKQSHGEGCPEGLEIMIAFGESEAELETLFRQAGIIGPDTRIERQMPPGAHTE